ncbi:MAG TPA: CRISPR-associated endonuclease Cas2 [bacterium]|nr:CRISPR-associated endonuclease Cas2 [bacterium]HPG46058.1 CRISPR-associated endonuclease Cas2 [bacterium]HPM97880.1 CRISPR-associated endonuclease Cas2 [bacterium]
MLIIVAYDIEDDRTRSRLMKKLKDFGPRVQYSVFEADLNPDELPKLRAMLEKVELKDNDSIRLYRICRACAAEVKIWGQGEVTKDKDYYIV